VKLFVESLLPTDPATAWEIFESKEFEQRLEAQTNIRCEVLEAREEGDKTFRRLRYTSGTELPKMVAKALGSKHLTYEQHNHFDRSTGTMKWNVLLPVLGDRVSVGGTTTISDHEGGCRRVVDGDISVKMRLIGGQIEKAVVGEFEKSMERAVDIARDLIRERSQA
jgi:hypothetical protein